MTAIDSNLHTWSNTSKQVKSYSVGLHLKDGKQQPLNTSNFKNAADIYIPRNASELSKYQEFNVIPLGDKKFIQYHAIDVNSSNYSVHIQLRPVNESIQQLTVLLRYNERPSPEKFDFNWTIPNFSHCSFRNVSRVVSNNATNSSATSSTETEHEVVLIDVERDCVKDPYIVSISNDIVTKMGKYYVGR